MYAAFGAAGEKKFMFRTLYIAAAAAWLLISSARAEDPELQVRVVDVTDNNVGVASTVYVELPQAGGNLPIGDTLDDGKLDVHYACKVGYRLWAKPKIDAYFSSLRTDCHSPTTLHLVPRQTTAGDADGFILKIYGDGSPKNYTFVSQIVLDKDVSTVHVPTDPGLPKNSNEHCAVNLKPQIFTSVFQQGAGGHINKVAEIKSSPETNANLTDEVSVFNLPCSQALVYSEKTLAESVKKNELYLSRVYDTNKIGEVYHDDLQNLISKYAKPNG
jgi:hypothetical protein